LAYGGNNPTINVDKPIINIVTKNVDLRPTKSPNRPKKIAPNGRTANPAAKAINAKINATLSFTPEKNCLEIIVANEPYK
jgi:hypothetical protein